MPVVNEELIEEQNNRAQSDDIPQIEADQAPVDSGNDVPALPETDN